MKNGKKYGKDKRKFSNIHNTYTYITISPLIQTYVHYYRHSSEIEIWKYF